MCAALSVDTISKCAIVESKIIERLGIPQAEFYMIIRQSERFNLRLTAKRLLLIASGTFIMSFAMNTLYVPHNILSGGITGISLLFHILFGIDASIVIVALNIPIFILGYIFSNKRFIFWSLIGMAFLAFFLWFTKGFVLNSSDLLTTILLGGVMYGAGFGLVFRSGASCGGNDIISKIINSRFSFSIPTINFALNVIVVALSAIFFGIDSAVRTLSTMYIASAVMKFVMEGINYKRTAFIISDKKEEIVAAINTQLNRGVTVFCGSGGYTGEPRNIVYCVIGMHQLAKLKMIVKTIDPQSFMNVMESKAVFGNGRGFVRIEDEDK